MDGEKQRGQRYIMATSVAKTRQNWGCEQKPLATRVATTGQTCIAGKKPLATQVAKLWQKLWQELETGRVSGKSLGNAEGTLHIHTIFYAAVGVHKRLLKFAPYAKQVTIFNHMVVASNHQT